MAKEIGGKREGEGEGETWDSLSTPYGDAICVSLDEVAIEASPRVHIQDGVLSETEEEGLACAVKMITQFQVTGGHGTKDLEKREMIGDDGVCLSAVSLSVCLSLSLLPSILPSPYPSHL